MSAGVLDVFSVKSLEGLNEMLGCRFGFIHWGFKWYLAVLRIEGGFTKDSIATYRCDIECPASVVFGSRGDIECINGAGPEGCSSFWWVEDGCSGAYLAPGYSVEVTDSFQDMITG